MKYVIVLTLHCNLYTKDSVKSVLCADDATLVIPGKSVNEICCCANATLQLIYKRLADNKLTVNCSKTKYMLLSPQPY